MTRCSRLGSLAQAAGEQRLHGAACSPLAIPAVRQASSSRSAVPLGLAGAAAGGAAVALLVGAATVAPLLGTASLLASAVLGFGSAGLLAARLNRPARLAAASPVEADVAAALDVAAVVVRTPEGTIRYWSGGAERLFGHTAAEAIGRQSHELLSTRFMEGGRRAALAELLRTGSWHGELRHRRRDGTPVTVATSCVLRPAGEGGETLVVESSTEATALKASEEALRASEGRLRLAQEVAGVGSWEWNADGEEQDWSREQHALFGTDPDSDAAPTMDRLLAIIHEDDRAAVRAAIAQGLETGEYEAEFRIRRRGRDGQEETRWLIGRGRRMPGRAGQQGVMLGVHVDITARKEAEERQMLLIREVDHRAKNALAVVQAVLRLTRTPDQASYVRAVEGRVAALARAQTLLTASRWLGADLRALVEGELAPFMVTGAIGPSVFLDGPPVMLSPIVAQPLSMALHELATNAVKYGSLGVPGGCLRITWSLSPAAPRRLLLDWSETGGPPVAGPPQRTGFGGRVLGSTVRDQLGGTLEQSWEADGLHCRLEFPLAGHGASRAAAPSEPKAGAERTAACP